MSSHSSSQVINLRALFEQNKDSTSPHSRGRSPNSLKTDTDSNSRPLSKVRTSFVAVERSGQMGPSLNSNDANKSNHEEDPLVGDGGTESKLNGNVTKSEPPDVRGNEINSDLVKHHRDKHQREETVLDEDEQGQNGTLKPDGQGNDKLKPLSVDQLNVSTENESTETKNESSNVQPTGFEPRSDDTKASETAENPEDLGIVMKGASFEQDTKPVLGSGDKEIKMPSLSLNQEQLPSVVTNDARSKEETTSKISTSSKSKLISSRSSTNATKKGPHSVSTATKVSPSDPLKKSPKTPTSPNVASRQPSSKTTSPRQPFSSKGPSNTIKESKKVPVERQGRASGIANVQAPTATKTSQNASSTDGKPVKRPNANFSNVKSRPKSPTRPVRLPVGATASTASSAAKIGDVAPSRSPSRASAANTSKPSAQNGERPITKSRDLASTTGTSLRKPSRSSLPAAPLTNQNPKPRVSTSSSKPSDGSFLARMMRPTQSSASKTHEKVEAASPPSKSHSIRPKRKSSTTADAEKRNNVAESNTASTSQGDKETSTPSGENAGNPPAENEVVSGDNPTVDGVPGQ